MFILKFEVILPVKLKKMKIYELVDIIDSIQSFDYDWKSYIVTVTEDFSEYKESEKITPIPTNVGAIDFIEYVYDEESLLEHLEEYINDRKLKELRRLIELGYEISSLIDEDLLEELVYNNKDIIVSAYVEVFITLKDKGSESKIRKVIKESSFNEYELIKASYYYLQPDDVWKALDESYYLIDYLNKLVKLSETSSSEGEGTLLTLRNYYPAKKTMLDLEKDVEVVIERLEGIIEYKTLIFNRVL